MYFGKNFYCAVTILVLINTDYLEFNFRAVQKDSNSSTGSFFSASPKDCVFFDSEFQAFVYFHFFQASYVDIVFIDYVFELFYFLWLPLTL